MNSNDKKADFSGVTSKVDSTAEVVPKADFSGVTSRVDSTAEIVGEQSYTVQKGDLALEDRQAALRRCQCPAADLPGQSRRPRRPGQDLPGQTLRLPAKA